MSELADDAEVAAQQRLRDLIQEGIDSGGYQPHDQVFEELRAYAALLSQGVSKSDRTAS